MYQVYSMEGCSSCVQAINLLTRKGLEHSVTKIDEDFDAWEKLKAMGLRTMPQIFKDDVLIPGGYAGLLQELK